MPDRFGRDARYVGNALRAVIGHHGAEPVETVNNGFEPTKTDEIFGEKHLGHGQQQKHVGAGPDKVMRISAECRFGAPGVDHDYLPVSFLDGFQAVSHVGRGHDTAVGRNGVSAQNNPEISMVNVGDGHQQGVAKQLPGREMMRKLIDRRSRENDFRTQRPHKTGRSQQCTGIMHGRITAIEPNGIGAAFGTDGPQPVGHFPKRLLPPNFLPRNGSIGSYNPFLGPTKAVWVFIDIFQGHRFGANMTPAKRVCFVAYDANDLPVEVFNFETANGFAEVTGPVVGLGFHVRQAFMFIDVINMTRQWFARHRLVRGDY